MKSLLVLLPLFLFSFFPSRATGLACCAGGNAKSFVSVKELQRYELGVATSFRDVYGMYNRFGDLEPFAKNRTTTLSIGIAARIANSLQGSFILPFVYRYFESGASNRSDTSIGDALLGLQYTLLEPVFHEDWYPTISLVGYIKAPSGSIGGKVNGIELPGTGNGLWEPTFGIQFEKPISFFTLTIRASYNWKIPRSHIEDGNGLELMESVSVPLSRRFLISGGSTQSWFLERTVSGARVPDSSARLISVFFTPSYFFSQDWSLSLGADFTVPMHGWGRNQPATQSVSLAARYALF